MIFGRSCQVFNMTLFCSLFATTVLLFGLCGSPAQACADYSAATTCVNAYTSTASNLTAAQLMNFNVYCGLMGTYKSCLITACGGWDALPEETKSSIEEAMELRKCDSPENACQDLSRAMGCGTQYTDTLNTTAGIFFNIPLFCQLLEDYKTCLTGACGSWQQVPREAAEAMDIALKDHNIKCECVGLRRSAWLIIIALSLAALISLG